MTNLSGPGRVAAVAGIGFSPFSRASGRSVLSLARSAIQMLPLESMARELGLLMLPPEKGDPLTELPYISNSETVRAPPLAIQALPLASMATWLGKLTPLPRSGDDDVGTPRLESTLTVFVP